MSDLFSLDDLGLSEETTQPNVVENDVLARLVYLLESMKIELPNWLKYKLQFADQLAKPLVLWSPLWKTLHRQGSVYGEGSVEEFKQCLDIVVNSELKNYEDRTKFYHYLNTITEGLFEDNDEVYLADIDEVQQIEKFDSGFKPFDVITRGGFYKSIVTVAGEPGTGKTSVLLNFLGALAAKYQCWYFQTEIPADLIKQRISLVKPTIPFDKSKVFCGNYNSADILKKVQDDPNPDRIIIYDSPEINNADDEIAYFKKVYQDLVAIKMLSKMVVVTSQTKQGLNWEQFGIYGLSASAAKARYTDIIIYVGRLYDTMLVKTAKNRFGDLGQYSTKYDYANLKLQEDYTDTMFEVK